MLGLNGHRLKSLDGIHMNPVMIHGLATNSIGYLIDNDNAAIWRSLMASRFLLQMIQETLCPNLNYLIIDMPPGTSDIQLTLSQNIPVTGEH